MTSRKPKPIQGVPDPLPSRTPGTDQQALKRLKTYIDRTVASADGWQKRYHEFEGTPYFEVMDTLDDVSLSKYLYREAFDYLKGIYERDSDPDGGDLGDLYREACRKLSFFWVVWWAGYGKPTEGRPCPSMKVPQEGEPYHLDNSDKLYFSNRVSYFRKLWTEATGIVPGEEVRMMCDSLSIVLTSPDRHRKDVVQREIRQGRIVQARKNVLGVNLSDRNDLTVSMNIQAMASGQIKEDLTDIGLSAFDRQVLVALMRIRFHPVPNRVDPKRPDTLTFTEHDVYRAMMMDADTKVRHEAIRDRIIESVERLACIRIYFHGDYSPEQGRFLRWLWDESLRSEYRSRTTIDGETVTSVDVGRYLFPVEYAHVRMEMPGGVQEIDGWSLIGTPAFDNMAFRLKEYIDIPKAWFVSCPTLEACRLRDAILASIARSIRYALCDGRSSFSLDVNRILEEQDLISSDLAGNARRVKLSRWRKKADEQLHSIAKVAGLKVSKKSVGTYTVTPLKATLQHFKDTMPLPPEPPDNLLNGPTGAS